MIEEIGIVLENFDNKEIAKILVEKSSACGNCSAKSFCQPFGEKNEVVVKAFNNIGAKKGDKVRVVIKSSIFLKASFFLYFIPIVAMLAGAFAGELLFHNDIANFILSGLFFIVSFIGISKLSKNKEIDYMAEIVEIL
jgi:sigma-E factor negative regulatory protein RseC